MLERSETLFKLLCAGLAALLIYQVARALHRSNPLGNTNIPALPSLPGGADIKAEAKTAKGTNASAATRGTNTTAAAKGTNAASARPASVGGTNAAAATNAPKITNTPLLAEAPVSEPGRSKATNSASVGAGASGSANHSESPASAATNPLAARATASGPAAPSTGSNQVASAKNTNTAPSRAGASASTPPRGANQVASATNPPAPPPAAGPDAGPGVPPAVLNAAMMDGMRGGPFGPGGRPPELPPEVQARVDRIIQSEVLGPLPHPQPVVLLGIAGSDAFLQGPDGQTGLVKEGDELGGVKLLKIAINRVLIEQDGEKKELTLFSGLGSESLLSNQTNHSSQ
jgi:hypothetical protein